jgi:hypothetical protein
VSFFAASVSAQRSYIGYVSEVRTGVAFLIAVVGTELDKTQVMMLKTVALVCLFCGGGSV